MAESIPFPVGAVAAEVRGRKGRLVHLTTGAHRVQFGSPKRIQQKQRQNVGC